MGREQLSICLTQCTKRAPSTTYTLNLNCETRGGIKLCLESKVDIEQANEVESNT